ncbi:hypothetical protein PHOBOS_66 [Erwinia phage vB_EamM_Phobos]|uniref:hypothetical protein n=1 Tax=Erwinia phage vB_EamM_Phobos TaxID=1883377 RepID=UPI00081C571B|nr:hypothetical protein BIZ79_gp066 [Erwinia phage vB_EamM_Phobos]ANZ50256.1 hypothetical protein PHOBOS_66 [Erwinia phage vB_EamM_Phobos]
MKSIVRYMLSADIIKLIDDYEKATFSKPTKLWDRLLKVLPHGGELEILGVQATSMDTTIAIIYRHDGVEGGKNLPIADIGSLGHILFMHCIAFATPYQILHKIYAIDYIYALSQVIASRITAGDFTTYPEYVKRIKPEDFDDSVSLDLYRFEIVGENRTDDYVTYLKAMVRLFAEMVTPDTSNNHNEIFPALMYGNKIAFGTYIPFPARIVMPFDDKTILPEPQELELTFSTAVTAISEKRYNLEH